MTLRIQALLIAALILFAQIVLLCLTASLLAHGSTNYSIDEPVRTLFFFCGLFSFVLVAAAFIVFDRCICARLKVLSEEGWLQGGPPPLWMNGKSELGLLANTIKQLFSRNNESAERENLIADHALDLICSLSPARIIMAINPASLAQIGYAPVSLMGRPLDRILVEEDVANIEQALAKARAEQSPAQVDLVIRTMQGALKDFHWTCEWSESAGSFFCVAHDVSAAKKLERVKHEFFSMVSHDLRTPITSVRAFMTHLETGGLYGTLTEKGQRHLHGVEENLDRMIRLTTDLLDLDKLEAGQMQIEQDTLKVQDLLNHSVDSVRQIAEQKRVTLVPQETDMEAWGDMHRLTQVLVNLLSNAIKFSAEDSTVEINVVGMRHQVEIQVVDHGRGIPQAMQDIIFERYKQVEVSDHKVKKGAGLGLAIARALVDAHNGQIGVSSEEGKGTKFWFRISKPRASKFVTPAKK